MLAYIKSITENGTLKGYGKKQKISSSYLIPNPPTRGPVVEPPFYVSYYQCQVTTSINSINGQSHPDICDRGKHMRQTSLGPCLGHYDYTSCKPCHAAKQKCKYGGIMALEYIYKIE
jgi:hypothetical protein